MYAPSPDNEFVRDVRAGLTRPGQKTLPCRYFYDDVGSALFEAITCLPEYGLTRADARILESCAAELADAMPRDAVVAELGSGTGTKTRFVLEQLHARQAVDYYPIDVARAPLEKCAQELSGFATVSPLEMSYLEGMCSVSERRAPGQTLLVLFLGSTIGNFDSEGAINFLYAIRQNMRTGDMLLLGTDLVKDEARMTAAYDDPTLVTAAFNLNLLGRINRELEGDFDLRQFKHLARWNAEASRIEMHLRSRIRQQVSIRHAGLAVDFDSGETICTEVCHKFRPEDVCTLARAAGFRLVTQWTDREWPFAESLLAAV